MNKFFKKAFIFFAGVMSICLPACGGNNPSPSGNIPVTGVSLSEETLNVEVDNFAQIDATITPANATNKALTWSSSDPTIATADGGLIIGIKEGKTTVKVKTVDGGFEDTCEVTVISSSEIVEVIAVTMVEAEKSLQIGETTELDVKFIPSNATIQTLTWSSTNANIASVDGDGVVTAVSSGTATITATSNNGKYCSCEVSVLDEWVDYVNLPQSRLNHDYKGKSFFQDGIGQVTLLTPIDGDTAHFTPNGGGDTIKSRFFGIDTPESTGKVQPYGKRASKYTTALLKEANQNGTIVVSSPTDQYKAPTADSTGARYVSLVWVSLTQKNAPYDELFCVNLSVCQEGLCLMKTDDEYTTYNDVFRDSFAQAKLYKLNMYSGEPDPDFNYSGDYQDVSLLDLKREVEAYLADNTHKNAFDNVKVRIQGTIVGYADNTMYIQDFFPDDPDDPTKGGEYAGINIFCGMTVIPDKFQKRNTYIEVCGLAQDSETFGFQITDTQGRWSMSSTPLDTDCKVILKAEHNTEEHALTTFETTAANLSTLAQAGNTDHMFCFVKVTTLVTVDYFRISTDKAITLGFDGCEFSAYIPFIYYGDPNDSVNRWDEEEDFMGKQFYLSGAYCYHKTTSGNIRWQVCPSNNADFLCADYVN